MTSGSVGKHAALATAHATETSNNILRPSPQNNLPTAQVRLQPLPQRCVLHEGLHHVVPPPNLAQVGERLLQPDLRQQGWRRQAGVQRGLLGQPEREPC